MRRSRAAWRLGAVGALALVLAGSGEPNNADRVCPPDTPDLDPHRLLRALSLDLRGVVPEFEEYAMLDDAGPDSGAWIEANIDSWLASDGFIERVVRLHRDLLWNNISNLDLVDNNFTLERAGTLWWRRNPALYTRGDRVPCLDEPARFGPDRRPLTRDPGDGTRREGWVDVRPYWAPDTTIRVCAFDAQETALSARGTRCDLRIAFDDPGCGCGPSLDTCATGETDRAVLQAFAQDVERRVADVVPRNATSKS